MGGVPCDMMNDFKLQFYPYFFNCYTYQKSLSMSPSAEDGNSEYLMPGLDNGLSVVVLTGSGMVSENTLQVDLFPGLHDADSPMAGSDGVRIMIHPANERSMPLAEGFDVPPGFSASLSVRPRRNARIGKPHGDCIDHHRFLHKSVTYRQLACQQICVQIHIRDNCHCYYETLPLDKEPDDTIPPCYKHELPKQCSEREEGIATELCVGELMKWYERLKCAKRVRREVQADRAKMADCECRAACDERYYDVEYSLARWPAPGFEGDEVYKHIFHMNRFMDHFNDSETFRRHFNETGDRHKAMEDFARINVYVADAEVNKERCCSWPWSLVG